MISFISIDSSLANTAIAWGRIDIHEVLVDGIAMIKTQKSKNKKVRVSSDTIDRTRQTYNWLNDCIKEHSPKIIFVETPSGSQNASGAKSYGATCQLIATLSPTPIEVSPMEVKLASVGNKKASKMDMIKWATTRYSKLTWKPGQKEEFSPQNEHMADAIAVAHAGIQTDEFKRIQIFLTNH